MCEPNAAALRRRARAGPQALRQQAAVRRGPAARHGPRFQLEDGRRRLRVALPRLAVRAGPGAAHAGLPFRGRSIGISRCATASGPTSMKILIAGASGLIGRATAAALRDDGHEVIRLVRRAPRLPGRGAGGIRPPARCPLEVCRSARRRSSTSAATTLRRGAGRRRGAAEIRASRVDTTRTLARVFGGSISDGPAAAGPRECLRGRVSTATGATSR